ncbi:MAG: hypothetical protein LBS69_06055 [Prevotellaceae bacterium]|jgi:hypothetical protein|nr:hypothetical protein [Prevotellaceae bacterium]
MKKDLEERISLTIQINEMLSIMAIEEIRKIHETMEIQIHESAEIPELGITREERELPEHLERVKIWEVCQNSMTEIGRDYVKEHTRYSKKKSLNTTCDVFLSK